MSLAARLLTLSSVLLALAAPGALAAPVADPDRPLVYAFVIDGLDGDRVDQGRAPFISRLLAGEEGARSTYYRESRAIMITETNPNHVAMATGAYGSQSGIPGNSFAIYNGASDGDNCPSGPTDESREPTVTSGESPTCLRAETFFETVARGVNPAEVTTAGIFGKPKLGRIFRGRSPEGDLFADFLFTPCERGGTGDDPETCGRVPVNPATGIAADDSSVMDEVIRTTRQGVPADGEVKRPNLTFVNLPVVDQTGHGTGTGPAYDQAIGQVDAQIRRFVDNQKALGLWSRTVMVLLSDHSMDSTPEHTSIDRCFRSAGISSSDFSIVSNGSAALVYLSNRTSPGRFELLKRMRAAALGCGPAPLLGDTTTEALYREDNPQDGGPTFTVAARHPDWRLTGERVGDLVLTHDEGGNFSDGPSMEDSFRPLNGDHGGPQTRDNLFAIVGGGPFVRQAAISGTVAEGFDDTGRNPGQAENVDLAPTVLRLLGRAAPSRNQGRFLAEAFDLRALPGAGAAARRLRPIRLSVTPSRAVAGRRTRFRFRATVASGDAVEPRTRCSARRRSGACRASHRRVAIRNAVVTFRGKQVRTDRRGFATVSATLRGRGTFSARATRTGFEPGSARVRATQAPRFTG